MMFRHVLGLPLLVEEFWGHEEQGQMGENLVVVSAVRCFQFQECGWRERPRQEPLGKLCGFGEFRSVDAPVV
jgi:hypothetical protein